MPSGHASCEYCGLSGIDTVYCSTDCADNAELDAEQSFCADCDEPRDECLCVEDGDHPDWYRNPTEDRMDREQDYDPRS